MTRDFYADLMGMEVKNDNGKTRCVRQLHTAGAESFRPRGGETAGATPPAAATPPAGNRPAPGSLVDHIAYRIYNWDTEQVREELMRRKLLTENSRPDTGGGIPGYSSFHVSDPDGYNLQISGWAGPKDSVTKKK